MIPPNKTKQNKTKQNNGRTAEGVYRVAHFYLYTMHQNHRLSVASRRFMGRRGGGGGGGGGGKSGGGGGGGGVLRWLTVLMVPMRLGDVLSIDLE